MNSFGFDLEPFANNPKKTIPLLSGYLNEGHLGLLLGAGASKPLGLLNWEDLVFKICHATLKPFVQPATFNSLDLKNLMQKVKDTIGDDDEYLKVVKHHLYDGVEFNFDLARKELLIALSSLIVGKKRGKVDDIITYNFDSVLEWYFKTMGLDVNVITKHKLLMKSTDVNITHIHGYLPADNNDLDGSDFLIFSTQEFEDRVLDENDYWKDHYYEFFRRHIFLGIGLSPISIRHDVLPYIRIMHKWYEIQKMRRIEPFGIVFLTDCEDELVAEFVKWGIVPVVLSKEEIYRSIFGIVNNALK